MKKIIILFFVLTLLVPATTNAAMANDLSGKILLQVEENGEAWYVYPENNSRYYMGRPDDAFVMMHQFGLGITNENLNKIPIGLIAQSGTDHDKDGLVDLLENAIGSNYLSKDSDNDSYNDREELENGYNPNGAGKFPENIDTNLVNRLKGQILLQVEDHGEAWYVNPENGKRYFLGRPVHAFEIMRNLGLGITNSDLKNIPAKILTVTYTKKNNYSIDYPQNWYITELNKGETIGQVTTTAGDKKTESEVFFHTVAPNAVSDTGTSILIAKVKTTEALGLNDFIYSKDHDEEEITETMLVVDNHSAKQYTSIYHIEDVGIETSMTQFSTIIMNNANEFYLLTMYNVNDYDNLEYNKGIYDQMLDSFNIL